MSRKTEFPSGTVFGGNFSEFAAWARIKVAVGEWSVENALEWSERIYRQTMLEQLSGVPQVDRPEELPEDALLFQQQ